MRLNSLALRLFFSATTWTVVILAVTILGSYWPEVTLISTLAMYLFILGVFVDGYLMWRRFKKVLAARLPNASPKGLLLYGMTRSTQIRRFRSPPPRIKRQPPAEDDSQPPLV